MKSSFSGHYYYAYRLNILAACDSQCCFIYVTCKAPDGSNNLSAYCHSTLPNYVKNLPLKCYVVGDNAYTPSEHLLTLFFGNDRLNPRYHAYSYYVVSQVCMHIEISFGRLVNKFRIFKAPLQCSIENALRLFLASTRLYNFYINEGEVVKEVDPSEPRPLPDQYYI